MVLHQPHFGKPVRLFCIGACGKQILALALVHFSPESVIKGVEETVQGSNDSTYLSHAGRSALLVVMNSEGAPLRQCRANPQLPLSMLY